MSESKPLKKAAEALKAAEKEKSSSAAPPGGNGARASGNTLENLYKRTGLTEGVPLSVFIQVHPGRKSPINGDWQKTTLEDTLSPDYQSALEQSAAWGNIGVLLGPPSSGLCSFDCDIDDGARAEKENELLLYLSPKLKETAAARRFPTHCQTFFRMVGDYPPGIHTIRHRDGTRIGEFRAGGQSVISGWAADKPKDLQGPPGPMRQYIWLNEHPVVEIHWSEIKWPAAWALPWMENSWEGCKGAGSGAGAGAAAHGPDGAEFRAEGEAEGGGHAQWWRNHPGCDFNHLNLPGLLMELSVPIKVVKGRPGQYSLPCPWRDGNTTPEGELDACVFPPEGKKWWGFNCVHAHCSGRGLGDLIAWCEGMRPGIVKWFCSLPELVLPSGAVPYPGSAQKLFGRLAQTGKYFVRGDLVGMISQKGKYVRLDADMLRSRIDQYFRPMAWRADQKAEGGFSLKPTRTPHDAAGVLLKTDEALSLLPEITAFSAGPVLAGEPGALKVRYRGYHEEGGGIYVIGGPEEITIPPVEEAVQLIEGLLSDFQFVSPSDRSRAIASFISPALRAGGLVGDAEFPMDVAEADASQSGKTYRCRMVCAAYGVTPYTVVKREGGVGSLDESFSAAIMSGNPFIIIDNFRGALKSAILESSLKGTGSVEIRVPHHGGVQIPTRYLNWLLSSNGVQGGRDFANRVLVTRILKQPMGYLFKAWKEGDALAHIKANSGPVLGAIFAVVIEWDRAGRPRTAETRHEFRAVVGVLDWMVQSLFRGAPLVDGHEEEVRRVSVPALSWLRMVAIQIKEDGRLGEGFDASALAGLCAEADIEIPGCRASAEDFQRRAQVGTLLKKAFGKQDKTSVGQFVVTREGKEDLGWKGSDQKFIYRFVWAC